MTPPLVEVFLVVEQPRQRLSYWSVALAPLDEPSAPAIAAVDAFYEAAAGAAIFALRYEEAALIGPGRLARIAEVATLAEATLIQASELSVGERRRFVGERLARCAAHVRDGKTLGGALVELVRRLRDKQPPLTQSPVITARGTRSDRPPPRPQGTRDLARGSERQAKLDRDEAAAALARGVAELARKPPRSPATGVPIEEMKRVVTEPISVPLSGAPIPMLIPTSGPISGPVTTIDPPYPPRHARAASPNLVARGGVHRANTVMMSVVETQQMLDQANATQRVPLGSPADVDEVTGDDATHQMMRGGERAPIAHSSDSPYAEAPLEPTESAAIYARYLRSGRWVPIRIGALSLKGATLMAGALPRLDDRVDISLLFGNYRALVRGTVGKLSTRQEAIASGAATFTVGFELEDASRRQLTQLLTAARAAKVTLKPPPPRAAQRFPVEWPIALGTTRGAVRAEALDVSIDGMFVKPVHALTLDANVTFTSVLDDALPPVSGHARVVRSINDLEARTAGLSPGYGVNIVDMPAADRARWDAFLARVEKRTARRVLVGASPARLAELQAGLVAAGYTATGGSDPGTIAQLATADNRVVDAALIDAGWLAASGSPSWVEALFSARNVPCVTMHGDARRARIAIDRLLSVS